MRQLESQCVRKNFTQQNSKWSTKKYQRNERSRRARENRDANQSLVTDYFALVEKIANVLLENVEVAQHIVTRINEIEAKIGFSVYLADENFLVSKKKANSPHITASNFLKKLMKVSVQTSKGCKNKNVFDDAIKNFAVYLFYVGGRLLYETLHANMKNALPPISTLNRYLDRHHEQKQQGTFDFGGLAKFLQANGLPKIVWISEGATRITRKIQYDSKTNKII